MEKSELKQILSRLVQINQTMLSLFDNETGEINEIHEKTYESLCEETERMLSLADEVIGAYVDMEKELQCDISYWEQRAKQCTNALKTRRNYLDVMRQNIMTYVKQHGGKCRVAGVDGCNYFLSTRTYNSVNCFDVEKIPMSYIKIIKTPDKNQIKQAIERGECIQGAEIQKTESVIIR